MVASLVESFYLLFKADTSPAKQAIDKLKKGVDQLTSSFNKGVNSSNQFEKALRNIGEDIARWGAEFFAAEEAVRQFRRAIEYGEQLDETSRILGVNISKLETWTFAIKKAGGTAQGFERSLHSLAEQLGTSSAVALELLPQFADAFSKLGRVQALRYGKTLGFDEPTILLLMRGRREVEALLKRQKELGVLTDKDRQKFQDFNSATGDLSHAFRYMWLRLSLAVLPAFTKLTEVMTRAFVFLNQNSELIVGALTGIGIAAGFMARSFILASLPILGTALAVGTVIAAIAILYEDIKRFVKGQPSLIGDFVNNWKDASRGIIKALGSIMPQFKVLSDAIDYVLAGIKAVKDYFSSSESKKITMDVKAGQNLLAGASASTLGTQTSASIAGATSNRTVSVGNVTIQTQATDAEGIAKDFHKTLWDMLTHANDQADNGVLI